MQKTWRQVVDMILQNVPANQLDSIALIGPHPEVLMPVVGVFPIRTPYPVLLTENGENSHVLPAAGTLYLSTDQCCRECGRGDLHMLSEQPDAAPFLTWAEPDLCSACAPALCVAAPTPETSAA
jgi:hypothetical protein